ncbi:MAG: sugar ABC transporter permease [Aerococcus sp.]|nr:sugar ABC transporter permease [Aerococcus sp.]
MMVKQKASWNESLRAYVYLVPMMLILIVFKFYPIFKSLALAFYEDYNIFTGEIEGLGIANFQFLFSDPEFYLALKNTFIYVFVVTPISILLSLAIAVMINRIGKLRGFFQSVYFLPFVTSTVAISIVWRWLYHSNYGLINYFVRFLGFEPIQWLTDPKWAMVAAIIMAIWKGLGFNILLFLVGLNNINPTYYSAAQIDGANSWQQFRHITVPLLGPTLFLVTINAMINNFKVFDEIYALFNGQPGPSNSMVTMVYYLYQKFYAEYNYGVASAAGIVLFAIVLVFTMIQLAINRHFVHYR